MILKTEHTMNTHPVTSTHTHTHIKVENTQCSPNGRGGEAPPLSPPPAAAAEAHMRVTHMLGGLLNIPLMERRHGTRVEKRNESQTNTTGKGEKKHWSFFHTETMNVGVDRVMR